jgi:iron(III) transport system ATP-binding protein
LILSLILRRRPLPPVQDRILEADSRLAVDDVSLSFGRVPALRGVSFTVAPGEVVCLLGPSGSGKSTLLRVIAGVERPSSGVVCIDGIAVASPGVFVPPEKRSVGMVFQDFALFPHLTVAQNVAFGLKRRARRDVAQTVVDLLDRVGLSQHADRYPHMLSGGERQRVALARALAPNPRILLMDEPFSSLDVRLRDEVRQHTLRLLRDSGTTTVMVTHDPDEALRVADRIALLNEGRLLQIGTPHDLYTRPATMFAARFFSDVNEVPATWCEGRLETPLGTFAAPCTPPAGAARVGIRPEHLRIAATPTPVTGRVIRSEFRGEADHVVVTVDGVPQPVTLRAFGRTRLAPGDAVHLEVPEDHLLVVPH